MSDQGPKITTQSFTLEIAPQWAWEKKSTIAKTNDLIPQVVFRPWLELKVLIQETSHKRNVSLLTWEGSSRVVLHAFS